jgi:hypothetical protein
MKLTIKKIAEVFVALSDLIVQDKNNRLIFPSAVRIKLAANMREFKPHFEAYRESRDELVKTYGVTQANGSIFVPQTSENWPTFKKERDDSDNVELDVTVTPVTNKELFQPTKKKDADGKTETEVEHQIDVDVIMHLQDAGILIP